MRGKRVSLNGIVHGIPWFAGGSITNEKSNTRNISSIIDFDKDEKTTRTDRQVLYRLKRAISSLPPSAKMNDAYLTHNTNAFSLDRNVIIGTMLSTDLLPD